MHQENARESTCSSEPVPLLAPNEPSAPTAILSPAKRAALLACLTGGGALLKQRGVWLPESAGSGQKPVFGITVADLSRDGMLTLTVLGRSASARLTIRGSWFARTAAAETVASTTTTTSMVPP
jgi:hypothetical protein